MVHAEMCDNWGYEHLHEAIQKRAIDEMKHAEKLINRILYGESRRSASSTDQHQRREKMHRATGKRRDSQDYNADMRLAVELGDNRTRLFSRSSRTRRSTSPGSRPTRSDQADGYSELGRTGGLGPPHGLCQFCNGIRPLFRVGP
jgi:hypothetical protein